MQQNSKRLGRCLVSLIVVAGFAGAAFAQESGATDQEEINQQSDAMDLDEINRQLNNPIASIWSLALRDTYSILDGDAVESSTYSNLLNFQPVLPIPIGEKLILINRPGIPLVTSPTFNIESGDVEHTTGLGDIVWPLMLGPGKASGFIWAVGPTFTFPTASNDALGKGKYQAGPAVLALYMNKKWVVGTLAQQWWSFAGDDDRPETSSLAAQYFIWRMLPNAWQVGMAPLALVDWKADSGNKVTLPVGLGVGKTFKLGKMPIKIIAEAEYTVVRPDNLGQHWNFVLQITPVFKNPLVKH
jgi:hypothetical protein